MRSIIPFLLLLVACGPGSEPMDGRSLYMAYGCAACHGAAGDGAGPSAGLSHIKPRDLRDVAAFSGPKTREGIASTIAFGVAGGRTGMPGYPDVPKHERLAMADFILSLAAAPTGLAVRDAYARPSNPAWKLTSAYMRLVNRGSAPRALVGARSSIAKVVEIHETTVRDGMMSMNQVDRLPVPAGGETLLAPGGSHLMLIELTRELRPGDVVPVTLTFDDGSTLGLQLEVLDAD